MKACDVLISVDVVTPLLSNKYTNGFPYTSEHKARYFFMWDEKIKVINVSGASSLRQTDDPLVSAASCW